LIEYKGKRIRDKIFDRYKEYGRELSDRSSRLVRYADQLPAQISTVLAGQRLGIKEVDDGIWLVSIMRYDLDYFDLEQKACNPSTTRSARGCHPCLRYVVLPMCPGWTVLPAALGLKTPR
jgi:hypothetical protein